MSTTVNYKGSTIATLSNETKTLTTYGKWMEDDIEITNADTAAISVVDTADSAGGTIREITALNISDTTAVASDVLSGKYFYTADGTKTLGSGQSVYVSSTGLLYTPVMTIDLSMERNNGYDVSTVLSRYGSMPYLTELTLTGIARNSGSGALLATTGQFSSDKYPLLKKLHIIPTEVLDGSGTQYSSDSARYNCFSFGHYIFTTSNLTELTLGKVGGPYFNGGGYYRNDCPTPPGTTAYNVGSLDGLTLKIYVNAYQSPAAGFMSELASNTTVIQYDYQTGEVLTS